MDKNLKEQMAMIDQINSLSKIAKKPDPWENTSRAYAPLPQTGRVSMGSRDQNDIANGITGTFTGSTMKTTMKLHKGREVLISGDRVFDDLQIEEYELFKQNQLSKQKTQ